MNFFEHQRRARRNTFWLVVLYVAAVLGILAAVSVLVNVLYAFEAGVGAGGVPFAVDGFAMLLAALVIVGATVYKTTQLASGGAAVARMVDARPVAPQTTDLAEKRLVNVVEEMAIASGTAVPGIYVMDDETGINAFAAGYEPNQAVIAVTRGALEELDRDELQGVIAHEFSHILNGDMRINVRMMGVLFGITCIGSIGRFLVHASRNSRSSRRRGGSDGTVALGLGLMAIGYIGVLGARIIKAAVARQREFLADASSVQFTRNPEGIAGALDRIAASGTGSLVEGRYAEELSHMFFARSVTMFFAGLMDTHPSLEERIRRVHPGFARSAYRARRAREDGVPPSPDRTAETDALRRRDIAAWGGAAALGVYAQHAVRDAGDTGPAAVSPRAIVATVGNPSPAHVRYAHGLLEAVPPMLRMMATEPRGAQALTLALVLAPEDEARAAQIDALKLQGADALASLALAPAMLVRKLGAQFVLPLFDLALPALRTLHAAERARLIGALRTAIQADRKVSLQEFTLLGIAERRLAPDAARAAPLGKASLAERARDADVVLSLLARVGSDDAEWVRPGFERAQAVLRAPGRAVLAENEIRLDTVSAALARLRELAPEAKSRLLEAALACVTTDDAIQLREAELVRLLACELDLPLPPILQSVAPKGATFARAGAAQGRGL